MTDNQDQQIRKLKRSLEGWRMALIPLKSVFLWEQQWHPCAIVGTITLLYSFIWLMDYNFLTTFAVLGLILNLVDFLVPILCNTVYGPNSWSGQKEKVFEEICQSIVHSYNSFLQNFSSFYSLRETSPLMYYIISIGLFGMCAWLSSAINNIFLLYILSTVMLLWPGVQHKEILNPVLSLFNLSSKTLKKE